MSGPPRILLGVSGSIAAYKAIELARLLMKRGARVQVALTAGARAFVTPLTFEAITKSPVLEDVLSVGTTARGEIDHVERAHEVDLVVIAPASANTLARIAAGMADDPVTATVLSTRAPILVAPAMESGMWENPATQDNLSRLQRRGVGVVGPGRGELASGRSGIGRMAEPAEIVDAAFARIGPRDLDGLHVVVTAGPTWEPIDPVRVLANRSTGAMGIAISEAAAVRGARVTLVLGPTHLRPVEHPRVSTVRVETAREMLAASERAVEDADVFIASAAVSDFRPADARPQKLKRSDPSARALELVENPDVLATVAARARAEQKRLTVVGFAAETEDVVENAQGKRAKKGCDLVIGNIVGMRTGFGTAQTEVVAVAADGDPLRFGPASKPQVAQFVLDQVLRVRKAESA